MKSLFAVTNFAWYVVCLVIVWCLIIGAFPWTPILADYLFTKYGDNSIFYAIGLDFVVAVFIFPLPYLFKLRKKIKEQNQ